MSSLNYNPSVLEKGSYDEGKDGTLQVMATPNFADPYSAYYEVSPP